MTKLDRQRFVCLDCETTGLDTEKDSIIELAVVQFDLNREYERYETLVNPKARIPDESIKIHHITQEMVLTEPTIAEVLPEFLEKVGDDIIVGHGIGFDIEMIDRAAKREKIPCSIKNNRLVDTLRLARSYGESPINSLEELRKHFSIEAEIAHRAMSDVIINIEVFKRLVMRYNTVEKMFNVLSRPILMRQMPLGKHKGRPFKEIPLQYLLWAANKDFDQDLLFSIRSEIKRRKSNNQFFQASNPFHNL